MKYYNIAAAVCAAIGIIFVFVGWDMGNGHFLGKSYEKGNFAILHIGLVWIVGAVILFAIPRFFGNKAMGKKYVVETEPDLDLGERIYGLIRVIAAISLIVGIVSFIVAFVKEDFIGIQFGFKGVVGFFVLFALSYITEASCVYIAKNKPRKRFVSYYEEDEEDGNEEAEL